MSRNRSAGGARAVLAAPALLLAGGSCAELTALDDYSVSSEPRCGALYFGDCGGCVAEQCCAEADACASDPDCEPWGKCMGACGDDVTCKADCLAAHPKTDTAGRLLGCIVSRCHDRCSSCADFGAVFGSDCGRCVAHDQNACATADACLDDASCRGWNQCILTRCLDWETDPACRLTCWSEYPEGSALFLAYARATSACSNECGWGKHWLCSPRLPAQWPIPTGELARVRLRAGDVTANPPTPISGAVVQRCGNLDAQCESDVHVTGGDGVTEIELEETAPPDGVRGYYFDVRAAGFVKTLTYHWHSSVGTLTRQAILLPENILSALAAGAGVTLDPARGAVLVNIADCAGSFNTVDPETSGVTFTLDEPSEGPIYARGVALDPNLRAGWLAYFFNVPVTGRTVTINVEREGRSIAAGPIRVEAKAVTLVFFNAPAVWQ